MKKLLMLALLVLPSAILAQKKAPTTYDLLIGTYTTGNSKGIYVYRFYTETGKLAYLSEVDGVDNPSYLCVSANHHFVYSVNEVGTDRKGSVSSFSFEPKVGKIELINKQPSGGAGPCYISIDKAQKNVFVANYAGGSLSVLPVNKDGSLNTPSQVIQDEGHSINPDRQEKPHVHTAMLSPDEKYLLYNDLGTDKLTICRYKPSQPQPLSVSEVLNITAGNGPRHLDFSPDKKFLYLITEMAGTIYVYDYHGGKPEQLQSVNMVPDGYKGQTGAADIHITPNGKFLYATNRGDANEIVAYAIDEVTGKLTYLQRTSSLGKTPRNFVIDPTGHFLLVANQNSDSVFVYKIDQATGKINPTGTKIEVGNPSCLKFVEAE